ncbi:MAG TPA: pentapeptide repeat-containing protein [Candidatus Saccharimonadales bacterium]|nr:pentapeptide repeat-containing protein [Candidatus Saccharimonadales bacterium]
MYRRLFLLFAQVIDLYRGTSIAPVAEPQADQGSGEHQPPIGVGRRIAAAAFAAGYFVLAGGQAAEAAPAHVIAQAESQGSSINLATGLTLAAAVAAVATAGTGVVTLRRQTREKRHERFINALRDVAGTSDAAQLQARINILAIYAQDPLHQQDVFTTAVQSLRARRATIIELREGLEGEDPTKRLYLLDRGLAKRRNADREMLGLLTQTRWAALEQVQQATAPHTKRRIIGYIGRVIGRGARKDTEQDKLRALRMVTGLEFTRNRQLVNAAGINLDLMRDTVADCDLSRIDLTGAGLQGNNFENVVFEGCDFGEAQLEGTTMVGCDLSGANFQAAYFSGDSDTPYFMGSTRFENCIIDKNTQFGHRPDNHPKARHHSNDPDRPQAYRGGGTVILRNLRSHQRADGTPVLSDAEIIAMVQEWRKNDLELDLRSDPKYLNPPVKPKRAAER